MSGLTFFPTPVLAPAPPPTDLAQRLQGVSGLTRDSLQRLARPELESVLRDLCVQLGGRVASDVTEGELHADGSPAIPSLVAVWLIGVISEAYAPGRKLIRLSQVTNLDALRSINGVADLLIRSINAHMGRPQ